MDEDVKKEWCNIKYITHKAVNKGLGKKDKSVKDLE